jgi:hypothetical protein
MSSPYIVTIEQVGANVVATGSGAIDLTNVGVLALGGGSHIPEVNPSFEIIKTGPWASSFTEYQAPLITGPSSSFGSGGDTAANSGSGDFVGIIGVNGDLYVPYGYISDNPLSDSAIYYNATFASLGVTPGTYVWTWGTGADQSFTIQIVATTPPNITITQKLTNDTGFSHTDLMTSDGHVTLSGTVSDVAGVANVEVE